MYYLLTGKLLISEPGVAVVDCGGVGYKCFTSLRTLSALPSVGHQITLYTHLNVREDALDLYGFSTVDERNTFRLLTSVSGVGPRSALTILSDLSPDALALCIASGDAKTLQKAPGIGAKTAQRIILELKGKLVDLQLSQEVLAAASHLEESEHTGFREAVDALCALGYSQSDAVQALSGAEAGASTDDLIRFGLKAMARLP